MNDKAERLLKLIIVGPTPRQIQQVEAADAVSHSKFLHLYAAGKASPRNPAHKAQLDAELEAGRYRDMDNSTWYRLKNICDKLGSYPAQGSMWERPTDPRSQFLALDSASL